MCDWDELHMDTLHDTEHCDPPFLYSPSLHSLVPELSLPAASIMVDSQRRIAAICLVRSRQLRLRFARLRYGRTTRCQHTIVQNKVQNGNHTSGNRHASVQSLHFRYGGALLHQTQGGANTLANAKECNHRQSLSACGNATRHQMSHIQNQCHPCDAQRNGLHSGHEKRPPRMIDQCQTGITQNVHGERCHQDVGVAAVVDKHFGVPQQYY